MTIGEARQTMWAAFEKDAGFRETYVANIACMLMDAQAEYGAKLDLSDHQVRMAVAERVFEHLYRESLDLEAHSTVAARTAMAELRDEEEYKRLIDQRAVRR